MENDNQAYRLHVRITGGDTIDLITKDKTLSMTVYKMLHQYISYANKLRKLRKKEEEERAQQQDEKPEIPKKGVHFAD